MKKLLSILLCLVMVIGLLAGCAPEENAEAADPKPTEEAAPVDTKAEEPEAEEVDYSDVEFTIAWWGGDTRHTKTIEIIEEFEKMYPGLKVNVDYVGWGDYKTKIATYAAGNDLPDVMQFNHDMVPVYAPNGMITPLDDMIADGTIDLSKCDLSANAALINEGKTYAVATGVNAYTMIYVPSVLEEAGVTLSMHPTISEYVEVAKTVYEKTGLMADIPQQDIFLQSLGMYRYADNKAGFDAESMAKIWGIIMEGIEAGYFPDPSDGMTWDVSTDLGSGKFWCVGAMTNNVEVAEADTGLDLALTTFSIADDATNKNPTYLMPTMAWAIAETSEHKDLAAAFINFFVNSEVVYEISGTDRGIPISADMKAFMAENGSPAMNKVLEYLNYLGEGRLTPMNAYTPAKKADADALYNEFSEECQYLAIPQDKLVERVEKLIEDMNAALAAE